MQLNNKGQYDKREPKSNVNDVMNGKQLLIGEEFQAKSEGQNGQEQVDIAAQAQIHFFQKQGGLFKLLL